MAIEFDHLFVCVSSAGTDEANALAAVGLGEGTPNTHPGQGTACRRFFFHNAYLELLWVTDPAEAQSEAIRPTHLWKRWTQRSTGMCPFGIGFRPGIGHVGSPPFSTMDYRPPYLPDPLAIQIATTTNVLTEPMVFYLSFARRPDRYPIAQSQLQEHGPGWKEITRLAFVSPHADDLSAALQEIAEAGFVQIRNGPEYLIELGFDEELQGRSADFRPGLPLVFYW